LYPTFSRTPRRRFGLLAQRNGSIRLVAPVIEDQSLQDCVWRIAGSEKFGRPRPKPHGQK
jgi:hypothetical protein